MNLRAIFRRTRPTPPPAPDFQEQYIAALNGYTLAEWWGLSELARKDCREHVAWKVGAR